MKRIMSLLILLFMICSIAIPFLQEDKEIPVEISEPIIMVESEETIVVQEIKYEPDPIDIYIEEMQSEMSEIESIQNEMEWYIAYKKVVDKYSDVLDPPETLHDYFTDDEIYLMQRVIETECFECDFMSKVNVASVILNRVNHGGFGESVSDIVTSDCQFVYGRKTISDDTALALEYAFQIDDTTDGCIGFHSFNNHKKTFNGWDYVFTDEAGHNFYR